MIQGGWTRRGLLGAGLAGSTGLAHPSGTPIRLGGPIFLKSDDPEALAREHRRLGYSAAYCPKVDRSDVARLTAIDRAFRAQEVVIAEVGAWVNMLDVDPEKRRKNLSYVAERLEIAEAVGAACCVNIAGSFSTKLWYGPDPRNVTKEYFDATVENCRKLIDQVRPKRTTFSVEMSPWNLPDGPDEYVRLIKAVDRPAFAVHLDICNIVNSPRRLYSNAVLIKECFEKLGPKLVSCHAKDLDWEPGMQIHFREVVPGRGQMDYRVWLRCMASLGRSVPLMLEHLKSAQEYDDGRAYIEGIGREIGVSFA
ncbi:MAG TPA: TIM barrel protein [Bryobacteraceae bacterium]|nr:TIM barrel protein [Bryobacteraceae bacterium]